MIVEVKLKNKNPFSDELARTFKGEITDDTEIEMVEQYANNVSPDRFFLYEIKMPNVTYRYNRNGQRRILNN